MISNIKNLRFSYRDIILLLLIFGFAGVGIHLLGQLNSIHANEVLLAAYRTSLIGRTPGERHNAVLAATALNGTTIAPGEVFSFNKRVKSWTIDAGFVKAPVSYDGELVKQYGGGVCQTSTTLYNAALYAGLPIVERHSHVFAPHYVTPGRDAAVAQYTIDLRFKNPYPWPIHIQTQWNDDSLVIGIYGQRKPSNSVYVTTHLVNMTKPAKITEIFEPGDLGDRSFVRCPGAIGYRVITDRLFVHNGKLVRCEQLGDNYYQALNRIIAIEK